MIDILYIIISACLVYIIGYPIVELIKEKKEKMREEEHDDVK